MHGQESRRGTLEERPAAGILPFFGHQFHQEMHLTKVKQFTRYAAF